MEVANIPGIVAAAAEVAVAAELSCNWGSWKDETNPKLIYVSLDVQVWWILSAMVPTFFSHNTALCNFRTKSSTNPASNYLS